MHDLTNQVRYMNRRTEFFLGDLENIDKIITDWLKGKAELLSRKRIMLEKELSLSEICEILALKGKTLEEKSNEVTIGDLREGQEGF